MSLKRIVDTLESNYIIFESIKISVIIDNDDKVWFCAKDVAESLEYKDPKIAIYENVEKDDKIKIEDINTNVNVERHPHTIYMNESGLYSLALSSKMKKAKKFKHWVTSDVLPSIREFNCYKLKKKYNSMIGDLNSQIQLLKKRNKKVRDDMKTEEYPKGSLFYVLDYTDDNEDMVEGREKVYRIGIAGDMKSRKSLYDTHMLHKKKAVIIEETVSPEQIEICMKSALYKHRYKNKKDFYICTKKILDNSVIKCKDMLSKHKKSVQKGGSMKNDLLEDDIAQLDKEKSKFEARIDILDEEIEQFGGNDELSSELSDEDKKPKKIIKKKN